MYNGGMKTLKLIVGIGGAVVGLTFLIGWIWIGIRLETHSESPDFGCVSSSGDSYYCGN